MTSRIRTRSTSTTLSKVHHCSQPVQSINSRLFMLLYRSKTAQTSLFNSIKQTTGMGSFVGTHKPVNLVCWTLAAFYSVVCIQSAWVQNIFRAELRGDYISTQTQGITYFVSKTSVYLSVSTRRALPHDLLLTSSGWFITKTCAVLQICFRDSKCSE